MSTAPTIALLFPGQGSQSVGMGRAFYDANPEARAVFEEADDALNFSLSDLIFNGPEDTLKLTENTQPAILTVSIAALRALQPELDARHLTISYAAGHSLGEYSAHVAAQTFSFADAVRTVRARGQFMQSAVPSGQGAMAAILGLNLPDIEAACAAVSAERSPEVVTTANLNSPDQTVISGSAAAVARVAELCKELGAKRAVMLPVSGPFHSPLMMPAQRQLEHQLQSVTFQPARFPVASNIDAQFHLQPDVIRDALIRQVTGTVRWVDCINQLQLSNVTHYIEVGPGKVLTGLNRQIDRTLNTANVEDPASLEKTLATLTA
ncbi:MAG TPA: ACP S-malonyltransferase [Acidobacteriaceae bacterium]|nr:ACP S-malonyltransferase [Acidobacteriaceae bacterium]